MKQPIDWAAAIVRAAAADIAQRSRRPSTAPSDLAQQRDAEDVLQQKRDGADG